jgi:hypothetical protein
MRRAVVLGSGAHDLGWALSNRNASANRRKKLGTVVRMVIESMEPRVLLSTTPNPASWMASLGNGIPLTDLSLPGTYNSAAGPGLQDALLGSGSSSQVNPPSPTSTGVNTAALVAHAAASAASYAALLKGGEDATANGIATAANTAALAADSAAGITQLSTGAGLALGLASDITALASAIASNVQDAASSKDATDDATAATDNAAVTGADTTAGANYAAAGAADTTAGANDTAAGTADTAAGGADTAAGTADTAAGTADTAAAVADGAAAVADGVSAAQGGIDPVSDGVTAGLDTAGAVADTAAGIANTAADAANGTADAADGTADAANTTADATNATADAANTTAEGTEAAADAADSTAKTIDAQAATDHAASATEAAISASSNVTGAASDALTAQQYGAFAAGMSSPDTTGGNSNNSAYQKAIFGLAVTEATTHSASAAAETAAAGGDVAATVANSTASAADTAAVNALAAANAANAKATAADIAATAANTTAAGADSAALAADSAALGADSAAIPADSTAEGLEATAGIADGVSAGAETAAATADVTAIALDATALATIEIPFVDIATAAAAGIADGVAAGLDATSVGADVADATADGFAVAADGTAAGLDGTAAGLDVTAAGLDVTAAADDATAATDDATAATDDAAAAAADAAAIAACETATSANTAADVADTTADNLNHAATAASALAAAADIAFYAEASVIQNTQSMLQTQSLNIADQLNSGIRSLDLRGAQVNDTINLNAGQYFTGTTLQSALNDMTSFLQANPSETIVVTLSSNEAAPINSSNSFAADLSTLLSSSDTAVPGTTYNNFIYSSSNPATTPTLGEVRGKIVIIPSGWTPAANNGLTIGWQPTQVTQDSHTDTDPNTRWNDAENDNNGAGLIPTDLGDPGKLYRNNLSQDSTLSSTGATGSSAVALGDSVDAIAKQYFGNVHVTRTAGIVGMDDPAGIMTGDTTETLADQTQVDQTLIDDVINQNNAPIVVTSDSDAPSDTGTLRDAINQANTQPGVNTIEFAPDLSGSTGNTIVLQSNLPQVTNDLVVDGAGSVVIDTTSAGFTGLQAAATHSVTETDYVASTSGVTPTTSAQTPHVYLDVSGITVVTALPTSTASVDPVDITYGTALANFQLHGFVTDSTGATIPGAFTYNSPADTVLSAGNGQSEAVTFTPTDASINPRTATVTVNVARATPTITGASASGITYGTPLANSQLSGTATFTVDGKSVTVPGTFVYVTSPSPVLHAGSGQSEAVTFIPTDTTDYTSASSTVTVNVAQATPSVTVNAISIGFGTPLDNTQLSGTATVGANPVPGAFTFTTANGTTLNGGNGQTEAVTFTPGDTTDYKTVSTNVTVNVSSHAAPTVALSPVNITYGTALDNSQLNSGIAIFTLRGNTVVVPGTFTYDSPAGTVLSAGNNQSEDVTFTPNDTTTYTTVSSKVIVNVAQATPIVGSVNPVNITYGTALADAEVDTFTPGGTITTGDVNAITITFGDGTTHAVMFPTGSTATAAAVSAGLIGAWNADPVAAAYATATGNGTAVILTSARPRDVINLASSVTGVGTLTKSVAIAPNSQLSGTVTFTVGGSSVNVPGTFTYTTAAGSVLKVGNNQSEDVTFTPNDTRDYMTASSSVIVNVAKATPIVGSVNPVNIIYGTALSNNPVAEVDRFTPGGTITTGDVNAITITFGDGTIHTVTFPTGSTATAAAVSAGFVAAWNADPIAAAYATATGNSSAVVLTSTAPGTLMNLASSVTGVGTLTRTITTAATTQLNGTVTFIVDGNTVGVPGKFTYTSAAGTVPNLGNGQSEAVTFTPTDSADYTTAFSTVIVNVAPIPPTVTIADAGGIYKGSPFTATGTVTGLNGVNLATPGNPTFYYYLASNYDPKHPDAGTPLSGAPSDVGSYVAVAVFTKTGNYGDGGAITRFSITPAATSTAITTSANPAVYGQPITYTATVANTSGTLAAPFGSVQFVVDGVNFGSPVLLNAAGVNAGGQAISQAVSPPVHFLTGASHNVQAIFIPSIPNPQHPDPNFPNPDFTASSTPTPLHQTVQQIAVEGTGASAALFIGSNGATTADQIQINPTSTGVQLQARINGVNTTTRYSQAFSSVNVYLQNGNDTVLMNSSLALNTLVSGGTGNDTVNLGGGNDTVTLGDGNDSVLLGDGNDVLTIGNGNDRLTVGNGSDIVVAGFGNDTIVAGNGNDLIVAGLGHHSVLAGNGNDILIDGNLALTRSGDSLASVLNQWTNDILSGMSTSQIHADLFSRLAVTYNTNPSQLKAGSGLDWFFYTDPADTVNIKSTDLHN